MKIRRLEFIAIKSQFNALKENHPATKWPFFEPVNCFKFEND